MFLCLWNSTSQSWGHGEGRILRRFVLVHVWHEFLIFLCTGVSLTNKIIIPTPSQYYHTSNTKYPYNNRTSKRPRELLIFKDFGFSGYCWPWTLSTWIFWILKFYIVLVLLNKFLFGMLGCTLQFLEPLELCYRSLCETGDKSIADGSLLDFMRQVSCFGLSLVKLDIRQESERHTDVMDTITIHLGIGSYRDWPEEQRQVYWQHLQDFS